VNCPKDDRDEYYVNGDIDWVGMISTVESELTGVDDIRLICIG